jgi:hypothetical protein
LCLPNATYSWSFVKFRYWPFDPCV